MSEFFLIQSVRGTHDWLNLDLFNFFSKIVRKHFSTYNFHEISTPLIEHTQLFKRSLGLETDVVSKEMFTILSHGNSPEELCLRPEATASVMRAFLQAKISDTPWKVYLEGPMFRYERPQKGRYRQFHQVSIEIIGADSSNQDVQLITMLERLFSEKLQLDSFALRLNFLGCFSDRTAFKIVLKNFLTDHQQQLCATCLIRQEKNILRIFDCKNETCQKLYYDAPKISNHLCTACANEWQTIKNSLELLSVSFSYDPCLVRGLDYYDKIVFEFSSPTLGSQSTFCGGGRYNGLARQLGADHDVPAIGAAMGIERVLYMLEAQKHKLALPDQPALYVIVPMENAQYEAALLLADQLRSHNLRIDSVFEEKSMKHMMRAANKMNAHSVLILGPDEQRDGMVTIKNMATGEQQKLPQISVAAYLKKEQ